MIGSGLSSGTMALLGGYLIAAVSYQALFLTGALLAVLGGVIFAFYFRVPRGELAVQPAIEHNLPV
jgi:predicted MFS family arabinose efflux permease